MYFINYHYTSNLRSTANDCYRRIYGPHVQDVIRYGSFIMFVTLGSAEG